MKKNEVVVTIADKTSLTRLAILILAFTPLSVARATDGGAVTIRTDFPGGNISVLQDEGSSVHLAPELRGVVLSQNLTIVTTTGYFSAQ